MRSCCVPFCKSVSGKNAVSFHEFPSEKKLRNKWFQSIRKFYTSKRVWCPNDHSVICSKHFKEDNFGKGIRRRLKPGAVPSIFCNSLDNLETDNMPAVNPISTDPQSVEDPNNSYNILAIDPPRKNNGTEMKDVAVQVQIISETSENINHLRRALSAERSKISRLSRKISFMEARLHRLKTKYVRSDLETILQEVVKEAENKTLRANFLLDQLRVRSVRQCYRWSENTMKTCIAWFDEHPASYDYAKASGLLRLPSRTTLTRFVNCSLGEFEKTTETANEIDSNYPESLSVALAEMKEEAVDKDISYQQSSTSDSTV